MIPFAPWLPDMPQFESVASRDAVNIIPSEAGFRPFPALNPLATAITARAQGAISVKSLTGTVSTFCGDATKLYKLNTNGAAWTDVSRLAGGAYVTAGTGWWNFVQFGNYVIATNNSDPPQYYDLSSSSNFAALAGSPPVAAFAGTIRDFVVLARTATGQIAWSGINNAEDWTPSITTMSDTQTFGDGGPIMGFVGGEYGVVLQESAIQRMSFEGPPLIFRFDKVANTTGCRIESSIAAYSNLVFFIGNDGFQMLQGGSQLTPIGSGKLDKWFEDNFNASVPERVSTAIDPINKLYIVSFPSNASAEPNAVIMYHWPTGQWGRASFDHEFIYSGATASGYTIDTMDLVAATIDALTDNLNSRIWTGSGRLILGGFSTTHTQGFFTGSNLEAMGETGDTQLEPGYKSLLRGVRPMVEGTSVTPTVSVGYRKRLQDSPTFTTAAAVNSLGYVPLRVNGRYHRIRVTVPAGSTWTLLRGIDDVKASTMGAR